MVISPPPTREAVIVGKRSPLRKPTSTPFASLLEGGLPVYTKHILLCCPFSARTASHQLNVHKARRNILTPKTPKPLPGYRGGNWELGTGVARLAVGAWFVNPMTAQLMSTPTEPYGAVPPVAGLKPVSRSGRVAARLKTTTSSICRVLSPALMAFWVHRPSCASHSGLYASACRGSRRVGKSPNTLRRSPPLRRALIKAVFPAEASSLVCPSRTRCTNPCACGLLAPVCPVMTPKSRSRADPRKSSPPLYAALFSAGT